MNATNLRWWKSSRSGSGANSTCVEVATADGVWYVRDSKNPDGGTLSVHSGQWQAFVAEVRLQGCTRQV
jgi:uncharacterized protein DUF397